MRTNSLGVLNTATVSKPVLSTKQTSTVLPAKRNSPHCKFWWGCCCCLGTFLLVGLVLYFTIVIGTLQCDINAVDDGSVTIHDGCTVVNLTPSNRTRRTMRAEGGTGRRLSFADVGRSYSDWSEPPLAYWEGTFETTGSFSLFANQLPENYLNEQLSKCSKTAPVEGCDFYYETIEENKVVDIKNFAGVSMRRRMIDTMYNFDEFFWETGEDCDSKVSGYNEQNFRHRFECGAKTYNDGARIINPYDVELVQSGNIGIFILPGGITCPTGVRVLDIKVYPVVYIEMMAHLYNIFIDGSSDKSQAIDVKYDYTPRSLNDMTTASFLPCVTRESVVERVNSIANN